LLSVEIVLASGKIVNANKDENPDLFWALRGGGGNFGIVTKFTFQAHPMPAQIMAGQVVFLEIPIVTGAILPVTKNVFFNAVKFFQNSDVDTTCMLMAIGGSGPVITTFAHMGDLEEGKKQAQKFSSEVGYSPINTIAPVSYHSKLQAISESKQQPGYYYDKSLLLLEISEEFLNAIWEIRSEPTPHPNVNVLIALAQVGPGKATKVGKNDTAFFNRQVTWWALFLTTWTPADGPGNSHKELEAIAKKWAYASQNRVAKYGISTYSAVSALDDPNVEQGKLEFMYGENLPRLTEIKQKFDPTNIFRVNRNIFGELV